MRCFAGLGLLLFIGCDPGPPRTTGQWTEEAPVHAEAFTVLRRNDQRRIIVFGPGGRSDTAGTYDLGEAAKGLPAADAVLEVPLARMVLLSTTHASYLADLGQVATIAGMAEVERVREPEVRAALDAGSIRNVGGEAGLDRELVVSLAPEAVLAYPFGREALALPPDGAAPLVQVAEYLEHHPLGRAEWLRFFGLLTGTEELADSLFRRTEARYESQVVGSDDGPSVFFGSAWQGTWWVPSGRSHMATLLRDAGARPLFVDSTGADNVAVDLERLLVEGRDADAWGMVVEVHGQPGPTPSDLALHDTRLLALPVFTKGVLFAANSATSDLFGRALLEPDVQLQDLVCLFHPERCGTHQPVYFRKVAQ